MRLATAIATLVALVGASSASAATLQQVGLFDQPMYVTSAPNDPDRLFVVEREGRIIEVRSGVSSIFADLSSKVSCCTQEQGLQSIALAPDFETSGRLYAFYTGFEGEIRIGELRAAGAGAPLSSLRTVLEIPHPGEANHYGGQLQFGPEGMLYVATGDGGGKDDVPPDAQRLDSLLGKILRIDPRPAGVLDFTVPAGNPFPGLATPFNAIWSTGLRNPYRFSFDRETGALLIGDVGQGAREEVDYAPAPGAGFGVNFGWNCVEGSLPGPAGDPLCASPPAGGYTAPIFDFPFDPGGTGNCAAIIGGYVVRDRSLGDLYGRYLYGDYCGIGVRSLEIADPDGTDRFENGLGVTQMTSFGEDACGRLYVTSESGRVSRLVGASEAGCKEAKPRAVSFIGIKAQSRKVKRGKRAQITAWVSPCAGRVGEPVKLMRGRKHLGTRRLDRVCSVRFRPKISRRANFRASVGEDANYVSATSRKLRIKILHRKKAQRRGGKASGSAS
jgi:Glucose / Sorbosone dehydrogenase